MRWIRVLGACAAGVVTVCAAGCGRDGEYSQETPDDVLETVRLMVEAGDAEKLTKLVYADNDQMRSVLNQLGLLMGRVQDLGREVDRAFPKEIGELRVKAQEAAASGKAVSLLEQMGLGGRSQGRRITVGAGAGREMDPDMQERLNEAVKGLLADPYAFLTRNAEKLSTVYVNDDTYAVLWDNKPIMPPMGLAMKRDDKDRWFIALPTNLPGASRFLPKTDKQYQVFGSVFKTFDKVVIDLIADVKSGRLRSLNQVGREAGEKAFIPVAMVVFAYGNMKGNERRVEREEKRDGEGGQ